MHRSPQAHSFSRHETRADDVGVDSDKDNDAIGSTSIDAFEVNTDADADAEHSCGFDRHRPSPSQKTGSLGWQDPEVGQNCHAGMQKFPQRHLSLPSHFRALLSTAPDVVAASLDKLVVKTKTVVVELVEVVVSTAVVVESIVVVEAVVVEVSAVMMG